MNCSLDPRDRRMVPTVFFLSKLISRLRKFLSR